MAQHKKLSELSQILEKNKPALIWYPVWKYFSNWQPSPEKEEAIVVATTYFKQQGEIFNLQQSLNLEERKKRCESLIWAAQQAQERDELLSWLPDLLAAFLFFESYEESYADELPTVTETVDFHQKLKTCLSFCASSELNQKSQSIYRLRQEENSTDWEPLCGTQGDDYWMQQFVVFPELDIDSFGRAALMWSWGWDGVSFCQNHTNIPVEDINFLSVNAKK